MSARAPTSIAGSMRWRAPARRSSLVSSDLAEVLALADRILVVRDGAIAAEANARGIDEERLNLLVQGAGVMTAPRDSPTSDRRGGPTGAGLLSRHAMLVAAVMLVRPLRRRPRRSSARPAMPANILRQSASVLRARPRHDAGRAGRRHRPLRRLGRARLGDAGRHRACRRAPPGRRHPDGRSASARRSASSTRCWSRACGSAR